MKRALVVALSVALFTTILGGLASADPANTVQTQADVVVDQSGDDEVRSLFQRCRRLLGEDELSESAYEKCVELWKRWCKVHPRARKCPRPKPPPRPCKVVDRVIDECVPCHVVDRVTDIRRPCPEPPPPCKVTDAVTDLRCCLATDAATDLRCCLAAGIVRPCPPPPPPPCKITDAATDLVRPCPEPIPIPLPTPIPLPPPCETVDSAIKCRPCFSTSDIVKCYPDPCLATDVASARLCIPPDCTRSDGQPTFRLISSKPNGSAAATAGNVIEVMHGGGGELGWCGGGMQLLVENTGDEKKEKHRRI